MQILKTYTQPLAVTLTEAEILILAKEVADTGQAKAAEEELQKNLKDQMKAKLSEMQARLGRLYMVIATGKEYRPVEIEVQLTDTGQVQEVRLDTGEIIMTRPPYEMERQASLGLKEV